MARALFRDTVKDRAGRPIPNVTVHVYEHGTTTPVAATLYAASTGTETLAKPFTTNVEGEVRFWLDAPQLVDVKYEKAGFTSETQTAWAARGYGDVDPDPALDYVWTGEHVFSGTLQVPAYTKAGLPVAASAGRLARVTDDVRGLWIDTGTQWIPFAGEVEVEWWGAKADGVVDCTSPINAAMADAPPGSVIRYRPTGTSEYMVTGSLIIPKKQLAWRGAGRGSTRLVGRGVLTTDPVVKWDDSVSGSVEHSGIEDMTIDRANAGPVLEFRQSAGNTGGTGDRWQGFLKNVRVRQTTGGLAGTLVRIDYGLQGRLEGVWVDGGTLGVHLWTSSHMYMDRLYANTKVNAPDLLFVENGGAHTIIAPRSEGSAGNYSYKFLNASKCTIIDAQTEGHDEAVVYHIENSKDLLFIRPTVAHPEASTSVDPRGFKFINSQNIHIIGGYADRFSAVSGKTFEVDTNCSGIEVDGMTMAGVDPSLDIVDTGLKANFRIYREGTTPPYGPWVSGTRSSPSVQVPTGVATFGTATGNNNQTQIVQNGSQVARFETTGITLSAHLNTANVLPDTDNGRQLGSATKRYQHLYQAGFQELKEMAAPLAGPADTARLFMRDVGAKTEYAARFPTGNIVAIAREGAGLILPVVATASLPAGSAAMDGTALIEDGGAGVGNFIIYKGGQRFRVAGGAAF